MKDTNFLTAIYYTLALTISTGLLAGLVILLDWPLSAEIPLAIALFIQLMYISRISYMYWNDMKSFSTGELLSKIKWVLIEGENKEEAPYYNHRSAS